MSVVSAQVSLAWNSTDAAGTTYNSGTLSGFSAAQPLKLIIVIVNAQNVTTDTVASADIKLSKGFAVSTSARGCMVVQSDDGDTAGDADKVLRTDCVAAALSTAGADVGRLDVNAWADDSFQLIVDVQKAATARVQILAIGGSDFDVTAVGTFLTDGTGDQNVTVTGFEASPSSPDQAVLLLGGVAALDTVETDLHFSFGVAAGSTPTNYVAAIRSQNTADPTDTNSYALSGESMAVLGATTAVSLRASVSAWITDGFTVSVAESAADRYFLYLAMKGPKFAVGDFTVPTDTNAFEEDTGLGAAPVAALFASCGRAASTSDASTAHAELSLGIAANTTDQRCVSHYDEDAVGTTDCDHTTQFGSVGAGWTSGGGTLDWALDLDSFDSDGSMMLHASNASAAASKLVWYLAIAPGSTPIEGSASESIGGATDAGVAKAVATATGAESIAGASDAGVAVTFVSAVGAESIAGATEAGAGTVLVVGTGNESTFGATDAGVAGVLVQGSASENIAGASDAAAGLADVYVSASEGLFGASDLATGLANIYGGGAENIAGASDAGAASLVVTGTGEESIGGASDAWIAESPMLTDTLPRPRMRNIRRAAAEHLARRRRP